MSDIPGTTRAQTRFLRAFRESGGVPPHWPAASVLRRWLRRGTFRAAMQSLNATLRWQADFELTQAAQIAAQQLRSLAEQEQAPDPRQLRSLGQILQLSHLRQRFAASAEPVGDARPAKIRIVIHGQEVTLDEEEDDGADE